MDLVKDKIVACIILDDVIDLQFFENIFASYELMNSVYGEQCVFRRIDLKVYDGSDDPGHIAFLIHIDLTVFNDVIVKIYLIGFIIDINVIWSEMVISGFNNSDFEILLLLFTVNS